MRPARAARTEVTHEHYRTDRLQPRRANKKRIHLFIRQPQRDRDHLRDFTPTLNMRCAVPFDADMRTDVRGQRFDDGFNVVEQSGLKERQIRLAGGDALRDDHGGR